MRLVPHVLIVILVGCAASEPPPRSEAYPGRCELVGLEQRELPSDQPSDQVALVATYRFGKPSTSSTRPVAFTFQVTRSRAEDLRAHLTANADVLCRPDQETRALDLPASDMLGVVEPVPAPVH